MCRCALKNYVSLWPTLMTDGFGYKVPTFPTQPMRAFSVQYQINLFTRNCMICLDFHRKTMFLASTSIVVGLSAIKCFVIT